MRAIVVYLYSERTNNNEDEMDATMKAQLIEKTMKAFAICEEKLGRKLTAEEMYSAIQNGMKTMIEGKENK